MCLHPVLGRYSLTHSVVELANIGSVSSERCDHGLLTTLLPPARRSAFIARPMGTSGVQREMLLAGVSPSVH